MFSARMGDMKQLGPQGSSLNASNISANSLTLNWTPAADPHGIYRYRVYESGKLIANVSGTTFQVTGLTLDGNYTFKVDAGDWWGNYTTNGPVLNVEPYCRVLY